MKKPFNNAGIKKAGSCWNKTFIPAVTGCIKGFPLEYQTDGIKAYSGGFYSSANQLFKGVCEKKPGLE